STPTAATTSARAWCAGSGKRRATRWRARPATSSSATRRRCRSSPLMAEEHGWEQWRWDPTLFQGAAPHYVAGRLPYAPGLAEWMAEALGLDGTGRLLAVGCAPGIIAGQLGHLFEQVVGLDPDPGMLE